jgi:hypothetical protein
VRPEELSSVAGVDPAGRSAEAISATGAAPSPASPMFLLGALGALIFKFEIIGRFGADTSAGLAAAAELFCRRALRESARDSGAWAFAISAEGIGATATEGGTGWAAIAWACGCGSLCAAGGADSCTD